MLILIIVLIVALFIWEIIDINKNNNHRIW